MRRLGRTVAVVARAGQPARVEVEGCSRPVRAIYDRWTETGRWWDGEARKQFFRVEVEGQLDLSRDDDGVWRLEVAWD